MDASGKGSSSGDHKALERNYRIKETLGSGTFSKVKAAEHILTGRKVAIKELCHDKIKTDEMENKVKREIEILRLLNHPHIVRLYEVIDTPTKLYVVMERLQSELFYYVNGKRLPEDEVCRLFQQIISGVEHCHISRVVHRDLKLENLLLDSKPNVKIVDFGLSNVMRDDGHLFETRCGSPNYVAPVVISSKPYSGSKADVWSCGVILYTLLCSIYPFQDENIPSLYRKIKRGIYARPRGRSELACDLIAQMLVVDPTKRITIHTIREHPWFQACQPNLPVPPPGTIQQAKKVIFSIQNNCLQNIGLSLLLYNIPFDNYPLF